MERNARLYIEYDVNEEKDRSISIDLNKNEMTIELYYNYCKAFASVMGFTDLSINKVFS